MIVNRFINSPVDSNCFVLSGDVDNSCIVVDPGTEDCSNIIEFINGQHLNVVYVFVTHEHIDHIFGLKTLKDKYDCKVICSSLCAGYLNNTRYNLSRMAERFFPCDNFPEADITFDEHLVLKWQNNDVHLYKMVGHSEGSAIMFIDNHMFVGDTMIKAYRTTTTLPGGSKIDLVATLERIFKEFDDPKIMVHFGHFASCEMVGLRPEIKSQISFLKEKLRKR